MFLMSEVPLQGVMVLKRFVRGCRAFPSTTRGRWFSRVSGLGFRVRVEDLGLRE